MNQFASGKKSSYYGKGDVIVYRLHRAGNEPEGQSPFFGANVLLLVYGNQFWPTYTTGDNTSLVATDSMKNFIQRETLNFNGGDLESYCRFLVRKFMDTYPQTDGAQITATEIPYAEHNLAVPVFTPAGPDRAYARMEMNREGLVEVCSGILGFKLLRLGGSAFHGFVRDHYTTLPDIKNRPLHMWLDLQWTYTSVAGAFSEGEVTATVRELVREVFAGFESGSIQQIIYEIGTKLLEDISAIQEIRLEANNRTWDTIAEQGESLGVYTDARPPYGCLGLTLQR
jgi:urate oxidase/2-oxo-4-hydroxy-4-carboxy-5-ureidoimidazoline decarboxylase